MIERVIHHPFCNKGEGPLEECRFCKKDGYDFFTKYPVEQNGSIDINKYFPNVQVLKKG